MTEPSPQRKIVGGSAAAMLALCAFVAAHEGEVRHTYVDRLGKGHPLSYCYGSTVGAVDDKTYTHAECMDALMRDASSHAADVQRCLPATLPAPVAASFYDLGYNMGATTFCRSSIARKAKAGDLSGACAAIGLYKFSNGRDCSVRSSGCYGVWQRRLDEMALCRSGLTP